MMRFAFAIRPQNYLIFGMHAVNWTCQSVQMFRFGVYKMRGEMVDVFPRVKEVSKSADA